MSSLNSRTSRFPFSSATFCSSKRLSFSSSWASLATGALLTEKDLAQHDNTHSADTPSTLSYLTPAQSWKLSQVEKSSFSPRRVSKCAKVWNDLWYCLDSSAFCPNARTALSRHGLLRLATPRTPVHVWAKACLSCASTNLQLADFILLQPLSIENRADM